MVISNVAVMVADAKRKADQSVDYTPRYGAVCPECGTRLPVSTSRPWEDNSKIRYHQCPNKAGCLLGSMGTYIKSVQTNGK